MTDPLSTRFGTSVERSKGRLVLSARGDIDISVEQVFTQAVMAAVNDRPGVVVVDLSAVDFMDSSGVRCLLVGKKAADAAAVGFTVRGVQGPAAQVLELTGVLAMLTAAPQTTGPSPSAPPGRWGWLKRLKSADR